MGDSLGQALSSNWDQKESVNVCLDIEFSDLA